MPVTDDGATTAPSDDQARPAPAATLSRTRAAVAAVAGATGLGCTALLVFDLFAGTRGGVPLIATLTAAVAFVICFVIGPGTLRRIAAGSAGSGAIVVAVLTLFSSPATAPVHDVTAASGSSPHVPRCPIAAKASALREPTAPEPGDRHSATLGQATIGGAGSYDGRPGIGPRMVLCVVVRRQPLTDRQLWLVVRLDLRGTIRHDLYFPKEEIPSGAGPRRVLILAHCATQLTLAGVGDIRTLMVVSADAAASQVLQANYNADQACDPHYDNNRLRWHLPHGAKVISNQADVIRTR